MQPGGRPPAPGQLAVVQAFLNTHFDLVGEHGAEVLSSPASLGRWLTEAGLLATPAATDDGDLDRALALRDALRVLARANAIAPAQRLGPARLERLDAAAAGLPCEHRFSDDGPRIAPAAGGGVAGALGALVGMAAAAMLDDTWPRLKICPGPDCDWAFYDHSRNQSGRWCSMSVCGGRVKARAHYHRRRAPGALR